jgi:hypothetical protein
MKTREPETPPRVYFGLSASPLADDQYVRPNIRCPVIGRPITDDPADLPDDCA